jgi:hypothetical protein
MKMKLSLFALLIAVVLFSCTSVPVPNQKQNTLLVGKFLVNWKTTGEMSEGNGTNKAGTKLYFQNDQTGKIISVSTQKDGWLLTNKLVAGHYTIQKFYIEKTVGNTTYQMTLNGPLLITIEEGKVNNLGAIQIDISNNGYTHKLIDYDVVKYDFKNEFSDSEWNSYEWKNIFGFNLRNKRG